MIVRALPSFAARLAGTFRCALLAALLLAPHLAAAASVCVLRSGDRLLLLQDTSSRWQFPGGTALAGELPQQTALRETWEETSIDVVATGLLESDDNVHVFACRAVHPVQVQGNAANLLGAPHLGREVTQARWVTRDEAQHLRTRFPQQLEQAYLRLHRVPDSQLQPTARFGPVSAFRQAEVNRVRQTQQWPIGPLSAVGNVLGEFWFYLLAMPVLWKLFGPQAARLMLMALMVVTLAVQGVKAVFPVPRPFSFDPALSLAGAAGPALPSGHTTSATCFFLLVAMWLLARAGGPGKLTRAGVLAAALAAGVIAGMARVWLGVHYWTDVAAGVLLGTAIAVAIHALGRALTRRPASSGRERLCWSVVAVTSLAVGIATGAMPLLLPFCVAAACAVVPSAPPVRGSVASALLLLAGLLVLGGGALPLAQRAEPFVLSASLQAAVFAGLGAWVAWGAGALAARLVSRRSESAEHA